LNGCYAGDTQHIAFFMPALLYQGQGGVLHDQSALCDGYTMRLNFGRNINHVRLTLGVEVA
jgi:hypothetical protein